MRPQIVTGARSLRSFAQPPCFCCSLPSLLLALARMGLPHSLHYLLIPPVGVLAASAAAWMLPSLPLPPFQGCPCQPLLLLLLLFCLVQRLLHPWPALAQLW